MISATSRIAAVDFGNKRVGLAMTDPLRIFAQPVGTFSQEAAVAELQRLHEHDGIETLVVGWPLEEDGSAGKATRRVEPFLGRLRKALPEARIVRQDERDTSKRAVRALVAAGANRKTRRTKGSLDAMAAVLILQDYLEEHPDRARVG